MMRRIGTLLLFTAAAGAAAWSAWPGSGVSHAATGRADVIVVVVLLAGLPLLLGRYLGPPGSRTAWWLRAGWYAAILAILSARAVTVLFLGTVPRGGHDLRTFLAFQGSGVPGTATADYSVSVALLLVTAFGLAGILTLTARRARVAPAALATGVGAGLLLGVAMYAMDPLGIAKYVTAPWFRGTMTDTAPGVLAEYLVIQAWVLLFAAPLAAGLLASWRCKVAPDTREQTYRAWARQGIAAAFVSAGVGALLVTVLGTGTTALLVKSAWVRDLLYHGQHLTASAIYGRELFASQNVSGYSAACLLFPIIGLMMGLLAVGLTDGMASATPDGGRPPGPPGPEPLPRPPEDHRPADVGALT